MRKLKELSERIGNLPQEEFDKRMNWTLFIGIIVFISLVGYFDPSLLNA